MADKENIRVRRRASHELELNLVQRMGNVIHSAARDLDQNIAGNLLSNRSRSCSMAQDLLTLLQLLVTLKGVRIKVSQLRYRALQELFGFYNPNQEAEIGTNGEFEYRALQELFGFCISQELPFSVVKHVLTTVDCQPTVNHGVVAYVVGQLKTDNDPPHGFSQCFVLMPNDNTYYILNDMFRLSLHHG